MLPSQWTITFSLAAALALAHWFSSLVAELPPKTQKALASLGGGFAIAYVFTHLMPELAIGGRELSTETYMSQYLPSPLIESCLFFTALLGIIMFFSLDVISSSNTSAKKTNFRLHILSFAIINYLYAYTLPSLVTTGLTYAFLFTLAIGAHIILTDRTLACSHPKLFHRRARWIFIASIGLGITHSYLFHPISDLTLAITTAFLGGGVLLSVFREEMPIASMTQLPWFLTGAFSMSFTLLIHMLLGH